MREKLQRFMIGRYGVDRLSKDIVIASCICLILSMLFRSRLLDAVAVVLLIVSYTRMLSRNINARYNENQKYLGWLNKIRYKYEKMMRNVKEQKTHHIYKCPGCGQKIRVPRGKGKISIRCPKCQTEFIKKS
ncbi:MAG: hypothetical protein E7256_07355 [Lachnospiraceae bacterium]|nr:hypothetical protein [Lachnospiraceae bacterium]